MTEEEHQFRVWTELTTDTPHIAIMGKLWCDYSEYSWEIEGIEMALHFIYTFF